MAGLEQKARREPLLLPADRVVRGMDVEAVKRAFLKSYTSGALRLQERPSMTTTAAPPASAAASTTGAAAAAAAPAAAPACVGVFAARRVKVDEDLGEYSGEHIRLAPKAAPSGFAFRLSDALAVDPAATPGPSHRPRLAQACIAHFVTQPLPHQCCTARFFIDQATSRITLRAIVEMEEGDEVLASYGGCRPAPKPSPTNETQCTRFAPLVQLTRAEQQRLSMVSTFAAEHTDGPTPDSAASAAVRVRVVEKLAPVVKRRLVKPASASRPRTMDRWTREETEELANAVMTSGVGQWEKKVSAMMTSLAGVQRTAAAAAFIWHAKLKHQQRFEHLRDAGSLRADGNSIGWSEEERQTLIDMVRFWHFPSRFVLKKKKRLRFRHVLGLIFGETLEDRG